MELCDTCKTVHEKWQAHVFRTSPQVPKGVTGPEMSSRPVETGFDRRAYQRAYMRSYRRRQSLMVQTAKALLEHIAEPWPRG